MKVIYFNIIAITAYLLSCYMLSTPIEKTNDKKIPALKRSLFNFSLLFIFSNMEVPVKPSPSVFILWYAFTEMMFSAVHHCLHFKSLYWIHKQHHEHKIPCTTSCFDAHPIEFFVTNVLAFALPLYTLPGPLWLQILWLVVAIVNTVHAHSQPGDHRIHHEKWKFNYGMGTYSYDKIMKTRYKNIKSK